MILTRLPTFERYIVTTLAKKDTLIEKIVKTQES